MDMLNFKHGLYANLFNADGSNKVEISNGTIYVTTDEKAMYVDLGGNRIRLSQIVNIPTTTDWQNLTPPYSKEAFYYIIEANALLKYTDSGWVQINSTTEIESILENMGFHSTAPASPVHGDIYTGADGKNYIYDNTITVGQKWVEIGKVGAEILDLEKALASINTTVATHGQTIETLGTDLDTAEADIDNLETIVGYKGKVDTLPTSDVTVGDIYRVGETYNVCTKIEDGAPVWEVTTNESARIEALKAEIARVKEEAGTAESVEALSQELTRVAGLVDDPTSGLSATNTIAKNAADAISDYETAHKDDYTNTKINELVADAKSAGTAAAEALAAYKKTNDETVANIGAKVDTLEKSNFVKADGTVKMTGNLDVDSHKVVNVAAPEAGTDAANKTYVDAEVGKANTAASNAQDAADAASQAAATAQEQANKGVEDAAAALTEAQKKTTMAEVEAKGYAVAETVNGQFSTLKGNYEGTLADLNTAASNAQTTATNAANAVAAITEGATAKTIKEVEDRIGLIEKANSELGNTYATKTELTTTANTLLGDADKDTATSNTIIGAHKAAKAAQDSATGAQNAVNAILEGSTAKTIKAIEDRIKVIEDADAVLDQTYVNHTELNTAIIGVRGETTETVASVDTKVTNHETRIADLEEDVEELNENLISKIQTADAMVYRGTVATEAELATKSAAIGGAHIGDTYKATAEFTMTNDTKVNIGDLLIASGTEDDNGIITAETLTWDHVPSGYVANYNPELTVATAGTNSVEVELTSAHAADNEKGDLGNFQISAAEGSALTVEISEGSNIAIGMTWGSF